MATAQKQDRYLPSSRAAVHVNTEGAVILDDTASTSTSEYGERDSRDIYLPAHTEWISHVAVDIGGSLAKVVYFTRSPAQTNGAQVNGNGKGKGRDFSVPSPSLSDAAASSSPEDIIFAPRPIRTPSLRTPSGSRPSSPGRHTPAPNGILGPQSLTSSTASLEQFLSRTQRAHSTHAESQNRPHLDHAGGTAPRRSLSVTGGSMPGGWLNFTKFETSDMDSCIDFIDQLVEASAVSHNIPADIFKARHVKLMATGGGAHLFYERLAEELGIEVRKEEEMQCLIAGLTFFMEIPHEVFYYSDELVQAISHPQLAAEKPDSPRSNGVYELPRPSPNPPQFSLVTNEDPSPQFPCMLVNIGSGVSIIKVDDFGKFERISGTSLGGGTLWGLLSMLTGADTFDEMLALSEEGDNSSVDMLVGDIYGSDYSKIGLKSSTIASSFGKVFRKGNRGKQFRPQDIAKSLLYAISNNIGQIAYMNAEKHNLNDIYFGGCFIRGHAATVSTLSYAIRFWSKGTKRALFLRHEGYLGAIGAWLRNIEAEDARL